MNDILDTPPKIRHALQRADAIWHDDVRSNTKKIYSQNKEAPLTDEEKEFIKTYMALRHPFMAVEFLN